MDSRGFFCGINATKVHGGHKIARRCPTEKRREQERRCGGNRSGEASGTGTEQEHGKPKTFFLAIRKSKKWYIKVVT